MRSPGQVLFLNMQIRDWLSGARCRLRFTLVLRQLWPAPFSHKQTLAASVQSSHLLQEIIHNSARIARPVRLDIDSETRTG